MNSIYPRATQERQVMIIAREAGSGPSSEEDFLPLSNSGGEDSFPNLPSKGKKSHDGSFSVHLQTLL